MRILIVRTDRIGDIILTTPLAQAIKRAFPSWHVAFLVDDRLSDLLRCHKSIDEVIPVPGLERGKDGSSGLSALVKVIRSGRFDVAVVVSPSLRNALAVRLAGIPLRIGTRYRPYSPLFNRRVPLHRKPSLRHEVEYNFDLLAPLGVSQEGEEPRLQVPEEASRGIRKSLTARGLAPGKEGLIAVHPGSGGSSARWPAGHFRDLIGLVEGSDGLRAVLTGSREEKGIVDAVVQGAKGDPVRLDEQLSLMELAALYKECRALVTNSTGPLHLAMAVGTPVVGLYCNLKACRPTRWGPYGSTPHAVLTPDEEICSRCHSSRGRGDCLGSISHEEAWKALLRLLERREGR